MHFSSYITDVSIFYTHKLHDGALNLFCIWDRHLYSGFSSHLILKVVSSHFVAKTTTCCICMWKLSFLKYGNTHLISELYYKIGRWFIFRKIIMFSVPLESGPGLFFKPRAVSPIFEKENSFWPNEPFALLSLLPTSNHLFIFRVV